MSWDVFVLKLTRPIKSWDELADDVDLISFGTPDEVRAAISAVFEGTDWVDPWWGDWGSEHGSIEFNIPKPGQSPEMMLHVRASSAVVPLILDLCEANGWTALDTGSAGVLSRDNHPERGLAAWREFRDKVVGTPDDGRPVPLAYGVPAGPGTRRRGP